MNSPLRVLLIEDSRLCAAVVQKTVASIPELTYLGCADTAATALHTVLEKCPDIIVMDLNLPDSQGFDLLESLRKLSRARVLVITSSDTTAAAALDNGASDFLEKPNGVGDHTMTQFCVRLSLKLKILCAQKQKTAPPPHNTRDKTLPSRYVAVIGASLGGPAALLTVLRDLPTSLPGIVAALHMPSGFTKNYAERLDHELKIRVREAEDGDLVRTGEVLIAPGGRQTRIVSTPEGFQTSCSESKGEQFAPSVDILFHSAAAVCGPRAVGVLLTGMGEDGARGLKAMHDTGAHTIVQDETTSVVWGMPGTAFRLGAASQMLPLENIAAELAGRMKDISRRMLPHG